MTKTKDLQPLNLTFTAYATAKRVGLSPAMVRRKAARGLIPGAHVDEYGFWRIPSSWEYVPLKRGRPPANGFRSMLRRVKSIERSKYEQHSADEIAPDLSPAKPNGNGRRGGA